MRWRFAVALGAILTAVGGWYWQSGSSNGVDFVRAAAAFEAFDDENFGGLSGYDTDGQARYLLTDRGYLYTASDGVISGVVLRGQNGKPLAPKYRDSEGLAVLGNGAVAISFEGKHRVALYDSLSGVMLDDLPPLAESFARLGSNSGLEALAVGPTGELVAIAERSGASTRPYPVFVLEGADWRTTSIPRHGAFLPVGADFGPDGRLYVLERDYLLSGFRSRIRRFDWREGEPVGEEILLQTRFGRHGNLEGIAVFEEGGERFIEMVSDNNFLPIQASEIVRYRLKTP